MKAADGQDMAGAGQAEGFAKGPPHIFAYAQRDGFQKARDFRRKGFFDVALHSRPEGINPSSPRKSFLGDNTLNGSGRSVGDSMNVPEAEEFPVVEVSRVQVTPRRSQFDLPYEQAVSDGEGRAKRRRCRNPNRSAGGNFDPPGKKPFHFDMHSGAFSCGISPFFDRPHQVPDDVGFASWKVEE